LRSFCDVFVDTRQIKQNVMKHLSRHSTALALRVDEAVDGANIEVDIARVDALSEASHHFSGSETMLSRNIERVDYGTAAFAPGIIFWRARMCRLGL